MFRLFAHIATRRLPSRSISCSAVILISSTENWQVIWVNVDIRSSVERENNQQSASASEACSEVEKRNLRTCLTESQLLIAVAPLNRRKSEPLIHATQRNIHIELLIIDKLKRRGKNRNKRNTKFSWKCLNTTRSSTTTKLAVSWPHWT